MDNPLSSTSASTPMPSQPKKPNTLIVSERLTPSEIESLRQDLKDSFAYMKEAFPRLKAERASKSSK
jgi:hypothetical protein